MISSNQVIVLSVRESHFRTRGRDCLFCSVKSCRLIFLLLGVCIPKLDTILAIVEDPTKSGGYISSIPEGILVFVLLSE